MLTSWAPDCLISSHVDPTSTTVGGSVIGMEGWTFSMPMTEPPTVVLVGSTCDEIKQSGAQEVNIIYDCIDPPR